MNDHLNIPEDVQTILESISNVDLNFVELPLPEHPKLSQFQRSIRVLDIDAKSRQQLIVFVYEQVLRDKVSGEEVNIPLPAPEWIVYMDTWSYLRGKDNLPVEVPTKEDPLKKTFVKVPSYKYMIWLMKSSRAQFLQLIETYLQSFIETKIEDLDKL